MKDGFKSIIGKRIAAVVVARSETAPRHQVFLVFPDGTRFEVYGENFTCCAGVDKAEGIEEYVESGGGRLAAVYGDASALEPKRAGVAVAESVEPIEELLRRDLDAWIEAKAAVERARK